MGFGSVINLFSGAGNLDQIADGSVYRRVIGVDGNGQITAASIADGAIQSNHLASGSVTGAAIADGTIQPNHLGFSLGTPTLTDGCIQSNHIAAGRRAVVAHHRPRRSARTRSPTARSTATRPPAGTARSRPMAPVTTSPTA